MKIGEANKLRKGEILVCYMAGETLYGKFANVESAEIINVDDAVSDQGINRTVTHKFYIPRTNIADAAQLMSYHALMHPVNTDDVQIGGSHYRKLRIQPIEYIEKNLMDFDTGNVVKYISRYPFKNGAEDVQKAIDYCTRILANKYNIQTTIKYESI